MKFGHLVLRKIIEIVATRCRDFKAKMHQIRFRLELCCHSYDSVYEYCSEKWHAFRFVSLLLRGSILPILEMSGKVREFDNDWRVALATLYLGWNPQFENCISCHRQTDVGNTTMLLTAPKWL